MRVGQVGQVAVGTYRILDCHMPWMEVQVDEIRHMAYDVVVVVHTCLV